MRFATKKLISKERAGFRYKMKYLIAWKRVYQISKKSTEIERGRGVKVWKKCFEGFREILTNKRRKQEMAERYRNFLLRKIVYELRNFRSSGLAEMHDKAVEFRNESLKRKVLMRLYGIRVKEVSKEQTANEFYNKQLKKRSFSAFRGISNIVDCQKKANKMHGRLMFKYICHAFLHWKTKIQRLRHRRLRILAEMNEWRAQRVLIAWRKVTLTSQIEQEKIISAFQIYSKLRLGFELLRRNTFKRKIIHFRRNHLRKLLRSWFEVTHQMKSFRLINISSKSIPSISPSPRYFYGSPDAFDGMVTSIYPNELAEYSTRSNLSPLDINRSMKRVRILEDYSIDKLKHYRTRSREL
jgi:hypothetical protein